MTTVEEAKEILRIAKETLREEKESLRAEKGLLKATKEKANSREFKFWVRVDKKDSDDCWNWLGGLGASGYGGFYYKGRSYSAARISWELANGHPATEEVLRKCDNRVCVNPNHLWLRSESHETRFWSKVAIKSENECWEYRGTKGRKGHGLFTISSKSGGAHRYAYEYTFGSIPEGKQINHRCDNPPCCNPRHLYVGTQQDNVRDREERNRTSKGSSHTTSKLTDEQVSEIRELYRTGKYSTRRLAKMYPVGKSGIHLLVNNETYVEDIEPIKRINWAKGSNNPMSKLNEEKVANIRLLSNSGMTNKELAIRFNMSDETIRNIIIKRTWN